MQRSSIVCRLGMRAHQSRMAKPNLHQDMNNNDCRCHAALEEPSIWTLTPGESNLGWGNTYPWASLTSVSSDSKSSMSGPPGWYNCEMAKNICIHAMLRRSRSVVFLGYLNKGVPTSAQRRHGNPFQMEASVYTLDPPDQHLTISLDWKFPALGRQLGPFACNMLSWRLGSRWYSNQAKWSMA